MNQGYKIQEWEQTFKDFLPEVNITCFNLSDGFVSCCYGEVQINNKYKRLAWDSQGRCYYKMKRIKQYDLKFKSC